ncbi:hypothetical protein DDB_G0271890 [Dictyostelium discoideum AX4]|uniref:Serine aminopeptidase S33 domain-containing protein n=1 Tax=Dictyostelium discoideum TaxID=44689 RepID=Q86I88_DICDI|nr:hypothetical protein DDB_G0271890 [Dictyostelium discoideum AX4]EAL71469.1 hypothetical protein DDB_G0271890 [Dictyostelium discoideum AX4]|eukprot:XP_645407.1 hypothetical protein DDB_G0271890 [Dictyostelium discoideum AX4]
MVTTNNNNNKNNKIKTINNDKLKSKSTTKIKSKSKCLNKFIIYTSISILIISIIISIGFIGFTSHSLLYFPWLRTQHKPNIGDPKTKFGIDFQDIEFPSFDGENNNNNNSSMKIRGWWIPASKENCKQLCVISIHGSGRDRYEWINHTKLFHDEGISILNYDSIDGVGKSDSANRGVGYSYREHKDVRSAIRLLKTTEPYNKICKKLLLTGMSLGGGSVIIAAAKDRHLIDGVIAESPYALASSAWRHNIFRFLGAGISSFFPFIKSPYDQLLPKNPPEIIVDTILKLTEYRIISTTINVSKDDTPLNYVDKISPKPILFIHATHDPVVPYSQSVLLYEKANHPKELWTVHNKTHQTAFHSTSIDQYKDKLRNFIKQL